MISHTWQQWVQMIFGAGAMISTGVWLILVGVRREKRRRAAQRRSERTGEKHG